jgi:hypothetical protein
MVRAGSSDISRYAARVTHPVISKERYFKNVAICYPCYTESQKMAILRHKAQETSNLVRIKFYQTLRNEVFHDPRHSFAVNAAIVRL